MFWIIDVICALNMKEKDTQGQIESVFNLYKNNLKDIIDSNINNGLFNKNNYL